MPAVSGLEQEFPGQVRCQNLDATTDDALQTISELGFKNHGLVVRSPAGEVLWSQPDHTVDVDQVRAKLQELLGAG